MAQTVTSISILLTAISICSRQFQFVHGNFNLPKAILICSRQFQFIHGNFNYDNFNFTHGDFNILTAISQFYSREFQFFEGNALGIFRFSHHLLATAADSGHAPKARENDSFSLAKSQNAKSKVDS